MRAWRYLERRRERAREMRREPDGLMKILTCLPRAADDEDALSLASLTHRTGLHVETVRTLVGALVRVGLVDSTRAHVHRAGNDRVPLYVAYWLTGDGEAEAARRAGY